MQHYYKHKVAQARLALNRDLKSVRKHVFLNHLIKPYDPTFVKLFPKAAKLIKNNRVIDRPNHDLTHTLRCVKLAPVVADFYANYSAHPAVYQFSNEEMKKMQVALLFFVVGRQNEMGFHDNPDIYGQFRLASAQAFKKYCLKHMMHLFKTPQEVEKYYGILLDYTNPENGAEGDIIRICHCLDLARCRRWRDFDVSVIQEMKKDLPQERVDELVDYAAKLIQANGNRIPDGPYKRKLNFNLFERCSHNVDYCLRRLNSVKRPHCGKKAKINFSV
jgi:hypothetical protein